MAMNWTDAYARCEHTPASVLCAFARDVHPRDRLVRDLAFWCRAADVGVTINRALRARNAVEAGVALPAQGTLRRERRAFAAAHAAGRLPTLGAKQRDFERQLQ